jgi:hypothetical protein
MNRTKNILPGPFLSPRDVGRDVGATAAEMREVDKILEQLPDEPVRRPSRPRNAKEKAQQDLAASARKPIAAGERRVAEKNKTSRFPR